MQDALAHKFATLIETHSGIIYQVIKLYADTQEDQQDLYQEIVLQCWKSFARFEGKSKFSTWLYRVSLNTILSYNRKAHREIPTDNIILASPEEPVASVEKAALYQAIKQLVEVDRMLILLHLEEYKNGEIAEIMGLTVNHVNVKLHRIKNQIIAQLKK
ncbi:MAG: RNA polymerase sigma factor [Saprospiraceae bacterium]